MSGTATENPVCVSRSEPPPPATEASGDPSEPHPDEPGAPEDAPGRRVPSDTEGEGQAGVPD